MSEQWTTGIADGRKQVMDELAEHGIRHPAALGELMAHGNKMARSWRTLSGGQMEDVAEALSKSIAAVRGETP